MRLLGAAAGEDWRGKTARSWLLGRRDREPGLLQCQGEIERWLSMLGDGNKNCEWIYRFGANPGTPGSGIVPLSPVLAPGTALGSRPRVALSSAQAVSVYRGPRPPGNSRLGHLLAERGDRIPLDLRAKTRMGHQGLRPEKDCREMSCAINRICTCYSYNSTFRKGGSFATGSR